MVLAELGGKLRSSLRKLTATGNNDEALTTEALNALLSEISRALIESDVNVQLVMKLRTNIQKKVGELVANHSSSSSNNNNNASNVNINRMVQRAVVDELTAMLTPSTTTTTTTGSDDNANTKKSNNHNKAYNMKRGKPNIILFVGLQGAGKTTSIAKFAYYYQRRGYKTAMVCADTFRAGAFDQLKQNATKLRIPFYGSYTEADPVLIAEEGVQRFKSDGYEVIIVDTSGRHRQESALFDEMQEISDAVNPDNTVFVMDATQGQAVYDQALAFHAAVNVGSVIVTKLDGHAKGGGAISAVAATGSPIIFLGSGERFEDLDPFNAKSFVSKLLGYGDVRGLMEEMKSITEGSTTNQEEMMEKMSRGVFTLRDMYKQFQSVMKLGPLDRVMGMIPGMPDYLVPQRGDDESTNRLRKFLYMMDSMNNAELDGKVDWHNTKNENGHAAAIEKRIRRIASGSGVHPSEVKMLLQAHKQFESMVSKMGKSGMMTKGGQAKQKQMMEMMKKNPSAMMKQLQNNPQAMQMVRVSPTYRWSRFVFAICPHISQSFCFFSLSLFLSPTRLVFFSSGRCNNLRKTVVWVEECRI
jgi:signal recognition particle subunit SRP54